MPPLERVGCRTLPNLFFRIVLFRRRQPRWRLGLNSIEGLLTPARGFRSSRHTCRKPLLFDPAQSACHQEGGGPLLPPAPGVVWFRLAFSLMFPTGRRRVPTSFFRIVPMEPTAWQMENGNHSRMSMIRDIGSRSVSSRLPSFSDDDQKPVIADWPFQSDVPKWHSCFKVDWRARFWLILRLNFASIRREPMRKLCALCLVTLLAVLVDIVFFHSRTANAQDTGNYKVVRVQNLTGGTFPLSGTVVGFSCVQTQTNQTFCSALIKQ